MTNTATPATTATTATAASPATTNPATAATASRTRRAALAVAAAVLAGLALPATTATADSARDPGDADPAPARYTHQTLDWQPCAKQPALDCATMTTPRDWHHPGVGADLTIAVSRHRATDPAARRGTLLLAAGGPGASGLLRPAGLANSAPAVGAAYDIVGFDQRGVGESTKAVCQSQAEFDDFLAGDYRDQSPAAIDRVITNSKKLAASCQEHSGDLIPYLNTEQTARDIDLFRGLLGERKLSYDGPSYASMIGAYYGALFPHRVDRMVLDSNIGFEGTWEKFQLGQPMSFQRRFDEDFLPWLAAQDATYHWGTTPEQVRTHWEQRRAALHDAPIVEGSVTIGPNQWDNVAISAIYEAENFPVLARLLTTVDNWQSADPTTRTAAAKAFSGYLSPDFLAEYFSVTCNDTPWTRDLDSWVQRGAENTARWPLVGARSLAFGAVCASWPVAPAPKVKVTGAHLPATLMLNSVHDPATYYEAALGAHRALRGSRLVTVTGSGDHGQYPGSNPCVTDVVERYLLDGEAPAHDLTCATPQTS
ncbi:TAP-like protein [Streptomyces sp. 1114.5]|uniref:alpha/beta hydrolase n=1 Tax=unclassified Streptomyces TaxID=2593676 RepID=UPI000BC754A0|nr:MULTISPECIES: alpha/beta hydrolase [unclassified Streptomyces]RKT08861.1 TAP-like protein [Streptomyces sp. 1114.5]SOB79196.1 TAP-like protein [Streptomyces sp. 1331.2]